MKNNFSLGTKLDEKNIEFDHKDDFLGVDILTLANKVDAVRGTMFGNMLSQSVCLNNPEPPRVFTRYENQTGEYSSSYLKLKNDYKIIKKIKKFDDNDNYYILIVFNKLTKEYDIIERKLGEKLTESYCYLNVNDKIDSLKENDEVHEGDVLYHSRNFDDNLNYSYGLNANAVYMINNNTIEDAIVVSDEFAERASSSYIHEIAVNVNTNDLLVNIYGDDKNYKSFPDIGEDTQGRILTSIRRINYENAMFDLKDDQLKEINYSSDRKLYGKGTVIDIDIYANCDIEKLSESKYNEQIIKYLKQQKRYYTEIFNTLDPIIKKNKKCTDDIYYLYSRAKSILNPEIKWKNDKTDFDNVYIVFKVLETIKIHVGSKIAGRFGDKGVVSKIIPKEDMPVTKDGKVRADIVLNPLGVPNRLNPAQNYEHELNFIAFNIQQDMKEMKLNDAKNFYFEFIRDVNTEQYEWSINYYKKLSKQEKVLFIKDIIENGIYIHQPPFWDNVDIVQLGFLYEKYGYKPYEVYIKGEKIENNLIIAPKYIIKMKHEPSGKMSARSTSYINMKNSPSKSLSYKKHEEPYSKTPIRLGEMELVNLLLTKNSKIQSKFNSFYSNNESSRKELNRVLLTFKNIYDLKKIESPNKTNGSKTLLNVLFKTISEKIISHKNKK